MRARTSAGARRGAATCVARVQSRARVRAQTGLCVCRCLGGGRAWVGVGGGCRSVCVWQAFKDGRHEIAESPHPEGNRPPDYNNRSVHANSRSSRMNSSGKRPPRVHPNVNH